MKHPCVSVHVPVVRKRRICLLIYLLNEARLAFHTCWISHMLMKTLNQMKTDNRSIVQYRYDTLRCGVPICILKKQRSVVQKLVTFMLIFLLALFKCTCHSDRTNQSSCAIFVIHVRLCCTLGEL